MKDIFYTIKYEDNGFYLYVKDCRMYRVKHDERLIHMLEGSHNNTFPINREMVELNTFPINEKDWYGNDKRETLFVLK